MKLQQIFKAGLVAAALFTAVSSQAATSFCSAGNTDGLAVSDVTYGVNYPAGPISNATDCYGVAAGNENLAAVNGLATWGGGFTLLDKTDSVEGAALGYTWTLSETVVVDADGNTTPASGTYSLSTNAAIVPAQFFDFVFVLKAATGWAAYYFDEAQFDGAAGGAWTVNIINNGGNFADLSHISIYGREGGTPPDQTDVPEPSSIALAGLALLGLGAMRRRRV